MVLRRFERRLEHLVEGTFARVFKSGLNPIEIGSRIVREIDANKTVAIDGSPAVPNHYWVYVSTADYERFGEVEQALTGELVQAARTHINDERYQVLGPVSVSLVEASDYPEGTLQVQAQWRQGPTVRNHAQLVLSTGERFPIGDLPFTVGRQPSSTLMLADANVSRHHAVIQRGPDGWRLVDVGSTNGTRVNGVQVFDVELKPGDQIVFGATPARFETN